MSFFDDADNRPPSAGIEVGEVVAGRLTGLERVTGDYGARLRYSIDGRARYAAKPLWRLLAAERVDVGWHVEVERLPDVPMGNGKTSSAWRLSARAPGAVPSLPSGVERPREDGPQW